MRSVARMARNSAGVIDHLDCYDLPRVVWQTELRLDGDAAPVLVVDRDKNDVFVAWVAPFRLECDPLSDADGHFCAPYGSNIGANIVRVNGNLHERWRCLCRFPDGSVEETEWITQDGADQMESETEQAYPGARRVAE
jgi:hypothetical protein